MDSPHLRSTSVLALCAAAALIASGCSCASPGGSDAGSADAATGDAATGDAGPTHTYSDAGPRTDGAVSYDDCADENNQKIFVLTTDLSSGTHESHLLRFDPEAVTYTHIGEVRCDLPGTNILHSMTVDRHGTAYVSASDGSLYTVDTTTAACQPTGMETGQAQVQSYGMGFATVGDTNQERLYITAQGGWWMDGLAWRRLGVIDTSTLTISMIGDLDAPTPANMELTGTGDGRLFGMVVDVRDLRNLVITIELLDPDTAATMDSHQVPLAARSGFDFAQWGGDFWLFTEAPDGSARVAQFHFETGEIVQTVDTPLEVPGTIVGAGVSTCAPYNLI